MKVEYQGQPVPHQISKIQPELHGVTFTPKSEGTYDVKVTCFDMDIEGKSRSKCIRKEASKNMG